MAASNPACPGDASRIRAAHGTSAAMGHNCPEHLNVGQHLRQKPTDASSLPGYSSGSRATSPDEVYEDLHAAEARRAPKAEGGRAFKTGENRRGGRKLPGSAWTGQ